MIRRSDIVPKNPPCIIRLSEEGNIHHVTMLEKDSPYHVEKVIWCCKKSFVFLWIFWNLEKLYTNVRKCTAGIRNSYLQAITPG
ncbi:Hypothetical protein GbCGDNIH4_7079 [Granulibacter bethesdensis CGDNIH4]|nr:Hypothetical protein GbCGDNIH4_7079 [Granulibacter bethesdensis CGDNIH4]